MAYDLDKEWELRVLLDLIQMGKDSLSASQLETLIAAAASRVGVLIDRD